MYEWRNFYLYAGRSSRKRNCHRYCYLDRNELTLWETRSSEVRYYLFTSNVNEEKERKIEKDGRREKKGERRKRERGIIVSIRLGILAELHSSIVQINRSNVLLKLVKPYLSHGANVIQERSFLYIYNIYTHARKTQQNILSRY